MAQKSVGGDWWNVRKTVSRAHPGQARSAPRKRARQRAKRLAKA